MTSAERNWSYDTTLDAMPISASGARAFVSLHLVDHHLLDLVDPVRLVVSELATNALVHGRTPFVVTLSRHDDTVRVMVSDEADWIARSDRAADNVLRPGGRGLGIVKVLSREWGVIAGKSRKTVWATFDTVPVAS